MDNYSGEHVEAKWPNYYLLHSLAENRTFIPTQCISMGYSDRAMQRCEDSTRQLTKLLLSADVATITSYPSLLHSN